MCRIQMCIRDISCIYHALATEKVHGAPKALAAKEARGHAPGNANIMGYKNVVSQVPINKLKHGERC